MGILAGILIGVLVTRENFFMEGKGSVAGFALLALTSSRALHGLLRVCEDCGMNLWE